VSCVSLAVGFLRAVASSFCRMLSAPLQLSCPCNYAFLCLTPLTFLTVILNCFLPHLSERSRSKCVQLPGSPITYTLFGFPFTPLVYKTPTHSLVFRFNRFHLLRATLAPRERNERASEHRGFDSGREDVTRPWAVRRQRCECRRPDRLDQTNPDLPEGSSSRSF